MITPKIGLVILLILPIPALIMSVLYGNTGKRKSFEMLFLISIVISVFFFYAYGKLLEFPIPDSEKIYYSDFLGQLFLICAGNLLIPITYFILMAGIYFVFCKFRRR